MKLSYEEMIAKLTDASYQIGRFTDGCDRLQSAEESVEAVIATLREAALAQQAQPEPLTDEMIEAESRKVFLPAIAAVGQERWWIFEHGAKWARKHYNP